MIVNKEGKILLAKSHKWFDKYTLPGGHIELGETMEEAVEREVKEEVGINVGDVVDVGSHEGKVVIEKIGRNWEMVMNETKGAWRSHPAFAGTRDSVETTHWLRNKRAKK